MSSAISTSRDLPAKAGSDSGVKRDEGFRISHFFILLSLVAATVAVILARPSAPENLILISLTIGAAGLAAFAFYRTIAPLVDPRAEEHAEPLSTRLRADLEREKALTLRSIKELEFDHAMGKLSQQDFDQMAGRLRQRALGIMQQLEAGSAVYRQEIERELAARVGKPERARAPDLKVRPADENGTANQGAHSPDRPASADAAAGSQVRRVASPPVACACGTSNDADAKFCKHCGSKLAEQTT